MATQLVGGTIIPSGNLAEILIEADNPGGQINPFGTVTLQADFSVSAPDLGGTITPTGEVMTASDAICVPAELSCGVDPVTQYDCVDVCDVGAIPPPPNQLVGGTIIPVGTVEVVASCNPVTPGAVESQTEGDHFIPFTWFKQESFYPAIFHNNTIVDVDYVPTHTVGVPLGHIGDLSPILPDDYQASIYIHTHVVLGVSIGGVIARVPLGAVYQDTSGIYWVYDPTSNAFVLAVVTGGDFSSLIIEQSATTPATGYEDQDVLMTLRVEGSTITGYANGVQKLQFTDSTFMAGGRAGVIAPAKVGLGTYIFGPFTVYGLDGLGVISDKLIDVDGTPLEDHLQITIETFTIAWSDILDVEELDISGVAGVTTKDVIRQRTISGLTPGTLVHVLASMSLNKGSVGSGMLFGAKLVGGTAAYFTESLGVEITSDLQANLVAVVPLSGEVVLQYGGFGDGSPLPAGSEWDNGQYTWVFQTSNILALDDCP